jgi:hypothetical protein
MEDETFSELMLRVGSYRNKVDACYIPTCDGTARVAISAKDNGETHFMCVRCAEHMLTKMSNLFKLKEN